MVHLGVVWGFLTSGVPGYIVLFFVIVGSILLLTVIFRAACSLANVEPPNYLYSLLLVLLTLVILAPINGLLAYLLFGSSVHETIGSALAATFLFFLGFIVCVLISSAPYIVLFAACRC